MVDGAACSCHAGIAKFVGFWRDQAPVSDVSALSQAAPPGPGRERASSAGGVWTASSFARADVLCARCVRVYVCVWKRCPHGDAFSFAFTYILENEI